MKHQCSSEILFDAPCQYNGEVDTKKDPFSVRKVGRDTYYYHYLDYARAAKEMLSITPSMKRKLCQHLVALFENGKRDKWIVSILASCGYSVEGK